MEVRVQKPKGLFSDCLQEVNRYKRKNYPIMNIHERTLSVLACRVRWDGGHSAVCAEEQQLSVVVMATQCVVV